MKSFFVSFIFIFGNFVTFSITALVKHTFEVSYFSGTPDGVFKEKILGVNGQFPGPRIEAFVGDILEVTVLNKIQDRQNVTLHWHGINQKGSFVEDGTSQVSQCPLPYGSFQVYKFNLTQAGTFWYHSHVRSQYTEGLFGALIVHHLQEPFEYDGEITLFVSDWHHRTAHANEEWFLSPAAQGVVPYPDSLLINGYGRYPCNFASFQNFSCSSEAQERQVFTISKNSTYRVRLINSAAFAIFNFSIDGHRLETIEVDGVDVAKPVPADVISISPGQRYSFLARPPLATSNNSTEDDGKFLIRSMVRTEFLVIGDDNINKYPEALFIEVTAVLERIEMEDENMHRETTELFSYEEILPPPFYQDSDGSHQIIHLNQMDLLPMNGIPAPDYFDEQHILTSSHVLDGNGVLRASFNNTPFVLPENAPLLTTLLQEGHLPANTVPMVVRENSVVQLVINNPTGAHPFHLHGHHFWIVGLGQSHEGNYDPSKHNLTTNAPLRDTVLVEGFSYAVIKFVADNPGVWIFHCHMDWHNLAGMIATIVEAPETLIRELKPTEEYLRICRLHG